jgi:glycosyltransferase involved in cell wall biosynthesis
VVAPEQAQCAPLAGTSRRGVPEFVHVPTPGDHYSPATGSAIMTIIYEIAREHAARGGRTRIIVSRGTRHDYPVGECDEVRATALPGRWQRAADAALGGIGLTRRFNAATYGPASEAIAPSFSGVVFVHNNPAAVTLFKRRLPEATICLWANNELFNTYSRREARRVIEAADRVICCSEYIAKELRTRLRGGGEVDDRHGAGKIGVVHNVADLSRFRPDPMRRAKDVPVVLFVGRVLPVKGADLLLKAALEIRGRCRPFKVRIVGSSNFNAADPLTPYERTLRELARPMEDMVQFQPFRDRAAIVEEYQAASIFCAPSNWNEPVSLTVPEALASGLATIASRRGGIPEVGGDAVLYFEPPNIGELARHLATLINDQALCEQWGTRARVHAEQRLSWAVQYENLARLVMRRSEGQGD